VISEFLKWFNPAAGVIAVITAWYTFYKNFLEGANVSVAPGGWVGLVVNRDPPRRFHIRGALLNDAVKLGTLQHLKAEVKAPDGSVQRYVWNQPFKFMQGSNQVQPAGLPVPIPVPGKSSKPLLVQLQLVAPDMVSNWAQGRHRFKILGWVNCKNRESGPNVTCVFHVNIGAPVASDPSQDYAFLDFPVEEWSC